MYHIATQEKRDSQWVFSNRVRKHWIWTIWLASTGLHNSSGWEWQWCRRNWCLRRPLLRVTQLVQIPRCYVRQSSGKIRSRIWRCQRQNQQYWASWQWRGGISWQIFDQYLDKYSQVRNHRNHRSGVHRKFRTQCHTHIKMDVIITGVVEYTNQMIDEVDEDRQDGIRSTGVSTYI